MASTAPEEVYLHVEITRGIMSVSSEVAGTLPIMHLSGTFVTRNFNTVVK